MTVQIEIVFSKQNTRENQSILEGNKERFNRQCQTVLDALRRGEELTTSSALLRYSIGDLRRRIKDLRDAGIDIKDELIEGRFKKYFL